MAIFTRIGVTAWALVIADLTGALVFYMSGASRQWAVFPSGVRQFVFGLLTLSSVALFSPLIVVFTVMMLGAALISYVIARAINGSRDFPARSTPSNLRHA